MSTTRVCLVAIATLISATGSIVIQAADAAETDFLNRFQGNWSGSGTVQRDGRSQPRQVTCSVSGSLDYNRIHVHGNCRAAIIFSRQIGADLAYDPRSGTYSGTYIGSRIGPARLAGTRSGDALNLRIEWPRPVNGDMQASMVIRNDGKGVLSITVADNLMPEGPIQQTSVVVLQRR